MPKITLIAVTTEEQRELCIFLEVLESKGFPEEQRIRQSAAPLVVELDTEGTWLTVKSLESSTSSSPAWNALYLGSMEILRYFPTMHEDKKNVFYTSNISNLQKDLPSLLITEKDVEEENTAIESVFAQYIDEDHQRSTNNQKQPETLLRENFISQTKHEGLLVAKVARALPKLQNKISQYELKHSDLKRQFLDSHREKKASEWFQFFRTTKVGETTSLKDAIQHAQTSDNRSRKVMVELGWLRQDGSVNEESAPDEVQTLASPSPGSSK